MAQRVRIDTNPTYPFKVTAQGVDLSGAQFNDLLFDSNARPLRIYENGYAWTPSYDATGGMRLTLLKYTYAVPSGQFPNFMTMWSFPQGIPLAPVIKTCGSIGCIISTAGNLYVVSYLNVNNNPSLYVNWCIFRNHS